MAMTIITNRKCACIQLRLYIKYYVHRSNISFWSLSRAYLFLRHAFLSSLAYSFIPSWNDSVGLLHMSFPFCPIELKTKPKSNATKCFTVFAPRLSIDQLIIFVLVTKKLFRFNFSFANVCFFSPALIVIAPKNEMKHIRTYFECRLCW